MFCKSGLVAASPESKTDTAFINTNIMKLSVIIPVYNEISTIETLIEKVLKVDIDKEIIVVDDFSTDGTRELLESKYELNGNLRILYHERNMGKGFAIRSALNHVKGDIVLIQDADLEYDPKEYHKLLDPIINGKTKIVYGSRFYKVSVTRFIASWIARSLKEHPFELLYIGNFIGIQILNFLVHVLYHVKITDEATCYKVFDKSVIKDITLKCRRFEFCPEFTAKVIKKGYKIYEVPISYSPRPNLEGKKITWRDGLWAIYTLIKYRIIN
jgi:glycosyltransferase involved in cell wall biosynthesis